MISNSKILTVSYGTFSCTLEGFDDSFGTMKAIAEYFRDLAADDRYFGAEPPTPDAEMLARIAEREISRRVEAREEDGKFVLRAEESTTSLLANAAADDQNDTTKEPSQAPVDLVDDAEAEVGAEIETEAQAEVEAEVETKAEAEIEAAKIEAAEIEAAKVKAAEIEAAEIEAANVKAAEIEAAEIEAAKVKAAEAKAAEIEAAEIEAAEAKAAEIEAAAEAAEIEAAEIEAAKLEAAELEAAELEAAAEAQAVMDDEDAVDADVQTMSDDEDEADVVAEDIPAPAADTTIEDTVTHPEPDSIAAKLRRIRSVVAQTGDAYVDDFDEDEEAQEYLSSTAADLDAALALDDANEPAAQAELPEPEAEALELKYENDDDVSSILARFSTEDEDEAEVEDSPIATTVAEIVDQPEPVDTFEDTLAQLMADAMPAGEMDAATTQETDEDERPLNARVVKMKRSDLEDAIATGQLEESPAENVFSETDTTAEEDDTSDITLSAEEEAELQRELAEVEAEFTETAEDDSDDEDEDIVESAADVDDDDEDDFGYDDEDAMDDTPVNENLLPDPDPEDASEKGVDKFQRMKHEADMSRIFDEADHQADEPDSSKRRNAIQHLRAAVAATRAEKKAGVEMNPDVDDTPYRTDLANVVRPRRPRADGNVRSERPTMAEQRPAPLKLVAEQRIDTPRDPIRPRRVTAAEIEESTEHADGSNFAEFAEEMGVSNLLELLEAAAAYTADVEGRPQFSRPMLMGKLKEVEGETFSREDGLRSFGQLLRQGKLQKLKGGRFAVTDETDFRAPTRNAG